MDKIIEYLKDEKGFSLNHSKDNGNSIWVKEINKSERLIVSLCITRKKVYQLHIVSTRKRTGLINVTFNRDSEDELLVIVKILSLD